MKSIIYNTYENGKRARIVTPLKTICCGNCGMERYSVPKTHYCDKCGFGLASFDNTFEYTSKTLYKVNSYSCINVKDMKLIRLKVEEDFKPETIDYFGKHHKLVEGDRLIYRDNALIIYNTISQKYLEMDIK